MDEIAYVYYPNGSLVSKEKVAITHQMSPTRGKMQNGAQVRKIGNTWFRM